MTDSMSLLDGLRSGARVASVGLSLALDERRARRRGLPLSPAELSAEWLEATLGERHPGVEVISWRILEDHAGTTARARIALELCRTGTSTAPPERLFLKLTPRQWPHRIFLAATGIGRSEVLFYSRLGREVCVRVPELHGLDSIGGGRYFALLLEDVAGPGVRFHQVGDRVDLADARRVVDALAVLHAAYWESPRLADEHSWLPSFESRRGQMPWERFVTGQMVGVARRRFGRDFEGEYGGEFERVARLCTDGRDRLERLWSRGARTLVHGDCHVGNLFFEGETVGFLDWQVCARAPGMRDVSYFLCNSFPSELRARHERELIERYLGSLEAHSVAAPSFEEAWSQHRLFALYTWIAAAFTAAAGGALQAPEIGLAGLRRAMRAVHELESVACAETQAKRGSGLEA